MNGQAGKLISRWHPEFFEKGRELGLAEGRELARAEGEARGIPKGRILAIIELRGLAMTSEQRERILRCTDAAQLDRWSTLVEHVTDVTSLIA